MDVYLGVSEADPAGDVRREERETRNIETGCPGDLGPGRQKGRELTASGMMQHLPLHTRVAGRGEGRKGRQGRQGKLQGGKEQGLSEACRCNELTASSFPPPDLSFVMGSETIDIEPSIKWVAYAVYFSYFAFAPPSPLPAYSARSRATAATLAGNGGQILIVCIVARCTFIRFPAWVASSGTMQRPACCCHLSAM